MNCRRRKMAATPSPNASKRKEPAGQNANDMSKYSDTHGMERRPAKKDANRPASGQEVELNR